MTRLVCSTRGAASVVMRRPVSRLMAAVLTAAGLPVPTAGALGALLAALVEVPVLVAAAVGAVADRRFRIVWE